MRADQQWLRKIELSSVALGGRIVAVSDEFFAEAFHLLLVEVSGIIGGRGSGCAHDSVPYVSPLQA